MTETQNDRKLSCEERVGPQLASRIEDLKALYTAIEAAQDSGDDNACDEVQDKLDTFALCVDIRHTMIVCISTGGPGDQFEIAVEQGPYGWNLADNEATYRFLDWFDGATRTTDNEAVMEYLRNQIERMSY